MSRLLGGAAALGLGALLGWITQPGPPARAHALTSRGALASAQLPAARGDAVVDALLSTHVAAYRPRDDMPVRAPGDPLGAQFRDGLVMSGHTRHRLILFTFDDGPDRHTTPPLLDRLDAAGVRAVFFLTGRRIRGRNAAEREQREIAREAARRGHVLASHTLTHRQLPLLDDASVLRELTASEQLFEEVLGGRPWLFRPPGGAHSGRVDKLVAERGYTTVLWNLGAGDTQVRTPEEVYQTWVRVFERRQSDGDRGGIVLLHDTHRWSVEAFDLIFAHLMRANCQLLERGEELYDVVDDPRYFFVPRNGRGPSAEAPPARVAPRILEARQERLRRETAQRCAGELALR